MLRFGLIVFIMLLIGSPVRAAESELKRQPESKKKNIAVDIDTGYVANERTQGTTSADRNLEANTKLTYLLDNNSQIDVQGKLSFLQVLSDTTQNHDFGAIYSSAIPGAGKLNAELGYRPFTDASTAANTNAETRFGLNYALPIDKASNLVFKGSYKNQTWNTASAQNFNVRQVGLNYQNRLSAHQDLSADMGYSFQDATTATNVFSELATGVNFSQTLAQGRKLGLRYTYSNRGYTSNSASNYSKNEVGATTHVGLVDLGLNFVSNVADNPANGYSGMGVTQGYSQKISDSSKWSLKSGLTFRDSSNAGSAYTKVNVQASYDQSLAENQVLHVSELLEDSFYRVAASSYLHNLVGIKFESRFPDNSSISLGERFTLDRYPAAATKDSNRHQIDLAYSWPFFPDMAIVLNGGYEIKSFSSPSAAQSDYNATNLSTSLDTKLAPDGKVSLVLASYSKVNAQNATQDTRNTNLSLKVSYGF